MQGAADLLWRVNNEYRKRLAQARTFLDLLEQMILINDGSSPHDTLASLRYAREQLQSIEDDHRAWRHRYYYESLDSKRMVQDDRAINHALVRFSRMRRQHEALLTEVYNVLLDLQRPDPALTRVPNGDLWDMTQFAVYDLIGFSDYMAELGQTG
jgi:hypothetical protein